VKNGKFYMLAICVTTLAGWANVASAVTDDEDQALVLTDPSCPGALDPSTQVKAIALPETPISLKDPRQRAAYARELNETLGANNGILGTALKDASERSDNFRILRAQVRTSDAGSNEKSMVDVFIDFKNLLDKISPPPSFSPSGVVTQANTGMKAIVRSLVRRAKVASLPPTIEQWLNLYSVEAPNFNAMGEAIQNLIIDVEARGKEAVRETEYFENVIQFSQDQLNKYQAEKESLEKRMREDGLSEPEITQLKRDVLTPLARAIRSLHTQIAMYTTIVVQKRKFIDDAGPVIEEVAQIATLSIPAVKNAAISHEDALVLNQLAKVGPALKSLTARSISSTTAMLDETGLITEKMQSSSIYDPADFAKEISALSTIVHRSAAADARQLEKLDEQSRAYDKSLRDARGLIDAMPTALPRLGSPQEQPQ
jgi:hypothetical protein